MRAKMMFVAGAAAGFVAGTRAGREKYDNMVLAARKAMNNPNVQQGAGAARSQASKLYAHGKDSVSNAHLGDKLRRPGKHKDDMDEFLTEEHQHMGSNSF